MDLERPGHTYDGCADCRRFYRAYRRAQILQSMAERVLIDGRLTVVAENVPHASESTYKNRGCRCEPCTRAHAEEVAERRRRRFRARDTRINGRLIAADPEVTHGVAGTYDNWGCRCVPCTRAMSARERARVRRP